MPGKKLYTKRIQIDPKLLEVLRERIEVCNRSLDPEGVSPYAEVVLGCGEAIVIQGENKTTLMSGNYKTFSNSVIEHYKNDEEEKEKVEKILKRGTELLPHKLRGF